MIRSSRYEVESIKLATTTVYDLFQNVLYENVYTLTVGYRHAFLLRDWVPQTIMYFTTTTEQH